jgi:putative membrane protein
MMTILHRNPFRRRSTDERLLSFLVRCAVLALGVWVAAELVEGIRYAGWESIALVAIALVVLNAFVRPLLILLSLPVTVLTLGLFLLGISALTFWIAAELASQVGSITFSIDQFFWDAVLGALVVAVVSWVLDQVIT